MGVFQEVAGPVSHHFYQMSTASQIGILFAVFITLSVIVNVAQQLLFKNPNEPPVVFHLFPIIGSTITYGMDPPRFFVENRAKFGNVFTFILLGKKTTVFVGPEGNEFILNGKAKDVNAEDIYGSLTTPVFGKDVVYDCPNSKLMEQKRLIKATLTAEAFRQYVPIVADETNAYFKKNADFKGQSGVADISKKMAQLTIFTASHCLQGKICRDQFDEGIADLYHDLDMGFTPINFMLPWAPLPQNRKRDQAREYIAKIYRDTINRRRANKDNEEEQTAKDIMHHLMNSTYKNGQVVPDHEIAHMMIALLMAGQHSSSATSTWIMLRLASRPDIMEELYQEQIRELGSADKPLEYEDLAKLQLHIDVIKEILRMHAPIHSIMRKVMQPMPIAGTKFVIPASHTLMAAPGVSGNDAEYFPEPQLWEPRRWQADHPLAPRLPIKVGDDEEQVDYGYGLISKGASSPYLPFGAGRHRCIGEQFAYLQLQVITATVVRLYKFGSVDGSVGKVQGTDYSSLFSKALEPAQIRWEKREKS